MNDGEGDGINATNPDPVSRVGRYGVLDFVSVLVGSVAALVVGVAGLVMELSRDRNAYVLILICLVIVLGLVGAASLVLDVRDRLRSGPPTTVRTGLDAMPPPGSEYRVAAMNHHLGDERAFYRYYPFGHLLMVVLGVPIAFLSLVLTTLYAADGSAGMATCAFFVFLLAAGLSINAWKAPKRPTQRGMVLFGEGLVMVDARGGAERVLRWDDVTEIHERGISVRGPNDVSPYPPPYQLTLRSRIGDPVVVNGQKTVGVYELRQRIIDAITSVNPHCRGLPRVP